MKSRSNFFTRLTVYTFIAVFIVSPFATAVFANKNYNSSIENARAISKLKDLGIDDAEIQRITDAFDNEVQAYKNFDKVVSNVTAIMKKEGVPEAEIKRILGKIGIGIYKHGRSFKIHWCKGSVSGAPGGNGGGTPVPQGSDDPLKGLNVASTEPSKCGGIVMINESGTQNTLIMKPWKHHDIQMVLTAKLNYITAGRNTSSVIRGEGINDEAKVQEIRDVLYEPIRAADTTYDAIDQAMVDFPFLAKIFGNEGINVYVAGNGDSPGLEFTSGERVALVGFGSFSIVTKDGKVESLNPGEIEDPTMRIYTNMDTINQLITEEITLTDALMQGKIRYEGVGFVNSIKFKVLNLVSGLLSKVVRFKAGNDLSLLPRSRTAPEPPVNDTSSSSKTKHDSMMATIQNIR